MSTEEGSSMAETEKPIPTGLARAIRTGDTKKLETLLDGACAEFDKSMSVWQLVATNGHPRVVPVLLGRGFDVDARDSAGNTALMSAVCAGKAEMVEALLKAGAGAEIGDKNGKTVLARAVMRRDSEIVKVLAAGGVSLDAPDESGWCALAYAAQKGYPEVAELLIRAGANPNAKAGSQTVLEIACSGNNHAEALFAALGAGEGKSRENPVIQLARFRETLTMAMDAGEEKSGRSLERCVNLLKSAAEGHVQTVGVLVRNGARSLQEGLRAAAKAGQPEQVMLLLKAGAQVNTDGKPRALLCSMSRFMENAIHDAVSDGRLGSSTKDGQANLLVLVDAALARHAETVDVLFRAGVDADIRDGNMTRSLATVNPEQVGTLRALIRQSTVILPRDASPLQVAILSMRRNTVRVKELVNWLVGAGADVNATDHGGRTPLMEAARRSASIVKLLLGADADANVADQNGCTPLMEAATMGNVESVELLLDAGADINATDQAGHTPLMDAARGGSAEVVKLLLDAGAEADAVDPLGQTPLMCAAGEGTEDVVKLLLGVGAKANVADWMGGTSLMGAALFGNLKTTELLLGAGADANAADRLGHTPVMVAANEGYVGLVELLLDAGADANAVDQDGRTPLMHATCGDVVDSLILRGADINHVDKKGRTPVMIATLRGLAEVMERLLDSGAASNGRSKDNRALLMIAAKMGHANIIAVLRKRGVDANLVDWSRKTALIIAAKGGNEDDSDTVDLNPLGEPEWFSLPEEGDAIQELLKAGADVNARGPDGITALMAAANAANKEAIKLLLKAGANIDAIDNDGQSALLRAAQKIRLFSSIMEELLRSGADPNIADVKGNTVSAYLEEGCDTKVSDLLRGAGPSPGRANSPHRGHKRRRSKE